MLKELEDIKLILNKTRFPSYIDDIGLQISSKNIQNNCRLLEKIADYLIKIGQENHIQFNQEKIELIHFPINNKKLDLKDPNN